MCPAHSLSVVIPSNTSSSILIKEQEEQQSEKSISKIRETSLEFVYACETAWLVFIMCYYTQSKNKV